MIVVDSSAWIDYFNGKTTSAAEKLDAALLDGAWLGTTDLVVMEVLRGSRHKRDSTMDCVVAQTCIEHEATLLTGDFSAIARHTRLQLL